MKQFLTAILMALSISCLSQNSTSLMTIKTNDGAPFFLYMNNKLQNTHAHYNVTVAGVEEYTSVKIQFEDKKSGSFQQSLRLFNDKELFVIKNLRVNTNYIEKSG